MGLFSKKEKVPQIAPASNLPTLLEPPKDKLPELPSLPAGLPEKANQEMVKSAVSDTDSQEQRGMLEELPKDFKFEESMMPTPIAPVPSVSLIPSIPKEEPKKIEVKPLPVQNSQEPIFVRIDKFQAAKKDLAEITKNIKSVEGLLGKMSELKSKEDSEVAKISESLNSIKMRLSSIDSNVFKKA
jgi:hypothetical protein